MKIPSASEVDIYHSLDKAVGVDHFLGTNVEDVEALFRQNSAYYLEDLLWMGPRAFTYDLPAVTRYLRSEHSVGEDHLISSLYDTIVFRSHE